MRLIPLLALVLAPWCALGHPSVSLVADSKGNLYYSDLEQVWMITPEGRKVVAVANVHTHELSVDEHDQLYGEHRHRASQFTVARRHDLMGLWTDARGNVYVANFWAGRVLRVAPDGAVRVVAESTFPWSPTGGLVTPGGDLWLLETSPTNAVRVRRAGRVDQ